MDLGQQLPDFSLPDVHGRLVSLSDYRGRIVILNFWSAECPFSVRTDALFTAWLAKWDDDVQLIAVASNRHESVELVNNAAEARGIPVVLIDAEHAIADSYEVEVTPHVFVLDRDGILRYRGAVDDVNFRKPVATRYFLQEAVEALLAGHLPDLGETPAYGCAIVREI